MKIRIAREKTRDTANVVISLDAQVFVREELLSLKEIDRTEWWIARDEEGEPVGYAGARLLLSQKMVYLVRAGVLPRARGNGLQRRLVRCRVNWGAKHGAETAITYTLSENHPSSNNLIKAGFVLYEPTWAWVGTEVLYWWKDL